jgi:hypothetical protein
VATQVPRQLTARMGWGGPTSNCCSPELVMDVVSVMAPSVWKVHWLRAL